MHRRIADDYFHGGAKKTGPVTAAMAT